MKRLIGAAVLVVLGSLSSCTKAPSGPGPADATYTVRGRVHQLPGAGQAFEVHHEQIPTFADKTGAVVGMKEMTMPFGAIASGVSMAGLKPGDAIEMDFEVRWKHDPRSLVTRVTKLPEGTALNLKGEPAPPPQ